MLTGLFMVWAIFAAWRGGYRFNLTQAGYSLREKLAVLPRVLPFLAIIAGVLYVLYGGVATPSGAARGGAMPGILVVIVVVGLILRTWPALRVGRLLADLLRDVERRQNVRS